MSAAPSASTGQLYGVQRVCRAWELARSSYYAWVAEHADGAAPAREPVAASPRGSVPAISDAALLAAEIGRAHV